MLLSPKRLITYFYPLLLLDNTSGKYLKSGDKWLAKTKVQNEANKQVKTAGLSSLTI
jgi:hypothetical protein